MILADESCWMSILPFTLLITFKLVLHHNFRTPNLAAICDGCSDKKLLCILIVLSIAQNNNTNFMSKEQTSVSSSDGNESSNFTSTELQLLQKYFTDQKSLEVFEKMKSKELTAGQKLYAQLLLNKLDQSRAQTVTVSTAALQAAEKAPVDINPSFLKSLPVPSEPVAALSTR